ncbi:ribokinase [Serinibacter arcticus]|uniref:Ribokinase n=1 Tax=Serinibacter arcticus TaxID=1655435 RepID=A0A4Z1EB14_9MICO|nr:ribokinase [Serinibacter arcticus]TGO06667.1 Ribokinase [Serinibacter arcticus]
MSVTVVGSANLDTTLRVVRIPGPGETVMASSIARSPGGKGANQAVGAARSGGADVRFVAALGRDADGDALLASLTGAGVGTDAVRRLADAPSGSALITVGDDGENSIVVVAGANAALTDLDENELAAVAAADVVLACLEIPMVTVVRAAREAARFVLNAAPSTPLPEDLWPHVDVLVVNEHEARDLTGAADLADAVDRLAGRVRALVVTLGARGAVVVSDGVRTSVPSTPVTAVDTTGAGDCFCGVLAARLAAGDDLVTATRWGSAAGALAVQRPGAADATPTHAEVAAALTSAASASAPATSAESDPSVPGATSAGSSSAREGRSHGEGAR